MAIDPVLLGGRDGCCLPRSWLFSLGALKGLGAVGLLIGIPVPLIGVAASVGLVLYFVGAIATVVRSQWYSHLRYPLPFLLPH